MEKLETLLTDTLNRLASQELPARKQKFYYAFIEPIYNGKPVRTRRLFRTKKERAIFLKSSEGTAWQAC